MTLFNLKNPITYTFDGETVTYKYIETANYEFRNTALILKTQPLDFPIDTDITISVNISPLMPNYISVNTNSYAVNKLYKELVNQGILEMTGQTIKSGFCEYPIAIFNNNDLTETEN